MTTTQTENIGGLKKLRAKNDGVYKECPNCKCKRLTACGCKKKKGEKIVA